MRYNRINLDGIQESETRLNAVALKAGNVVNISAADKFELSVDGSGQVYVATAAYSQGLDADETIPVDSSTQAEYVSPSRELAVIAGAGSYVKDEGLTFANGQVAKVTAAEEVYAYAQETATLTAGELLRIRIK